MPTGQCPLCLQQRTLVDSHLAPKAMYKYAADPDEDGGAPMVVTRGGRRRVTRQVKQYLLCSECDNRLNKYGENYALQQVWNGSRFPLLDRLNLALTVRGSADGEVYSGLASGIDTEKLAYFALSVLWRAGVSEWRTSKGTTHRVDLGSHQESLRAYLHGETGFPSEASVMATVCTDIYSRIFYMPSPAILRMSPPVPAFSFTALGVNFLIVLGPFAPEQICCVRSPKRLISKRDCSKKVIDAWNLMHSEVPKADSALAAKKA